MATAGAVVDRLLRRLASGARRSELPSDIDLHVAHVRRTGARRSELPSDIDLHVAHVRRTLSTLRDVLVSVDIYFWVRTEVQDWMTKISQIVYDMENLLDEFEDQNDTESQRSGCITKATSLCSPCPFFLYSTRVNRMKTLRKRLDHLARNSVIFTMMQHPRCDVEQTDMQEEFCRAAIVGRDSDKTKIEELILQDNAETLCIIPIVGLVGLGKTTLARLIFHDQGEGWDFDLRIWIDLNRKFDLRKIAADIISQANETKEEGPSVVNTSIEIHGNLQLLKNRLQETLNGKHCLIVLDGLCSTDKSQLDELKEMLRAKNKSIKVLVTTSSEITAELMHTFTPYKLLPLSEDDCWAIFSEKAFGDGGRVNAHLETIGKQIAKRCDGLPALAHFLGSIVHNQVMHVWLTARDEPIWKLGETFSGKTKLFSSLNQIYCDMPSALKLCFLYLSVLPMGSAIDKEKLIQQWIALDMVGSKYGTLPPYIHGEMYIQDLLSIHFLQVTKTHSVYGMGSGTSPTTLYMHNFVHDFARHVACNDIIILDDREISDNAKDLSFQYALLTYYRGQSTLCSSLLTGARALHFLNVEAIKLHREPFELLKHLRVLNLSRSCLRELPTSIGNLKHLRYLDISGSKVQTLPSSMSMLINLEALDLSNTSLKELPSFIGSLEKLKYLNLQGCDLLQSLPATLGYLQTLEHLRLSCYDVSELDDSLCKLQDLRLFDLSSCTELPQLPPSFGNLMNLEDLNLSSCFNLKQLPESFGNLYFLRFLNMSSCYELKQLPGSLCNLLKLEVLILRRCRKLQNLPPSFGDIQSLRILDLTGCEALDLIIDMLTTNLEYLNLQQCLKLPTRPNLFINLTRLKFLNLSQCTPTIDCLQSLGYLFNLEYLNLSQNLLVIPACFMRLQKLHTLDLTGCALKHPSHSVSQMFLGIIHKMTGLKFLLTKDPMIVACLPPYIRCSISIRENWHITTDELVIPDLTRGSRGLSIAESANLQNRPELRFLKLEWTNTSHRAVHGVVEDLGEEVLEKLLPHQNLEYLELAGYSGFAWPTWMMNNMVTSLPNLVSLHLFFLGNCIDLPPLGQLINLRHLHIKDMPNIVNLEMGLSGGPQPFKKLTHLKLEILLNLEELPILSTTNNGNQQFMFPALEELSVLFCPNLMFKPSLPKCVKYEVKNSNRILLCGEPLGPLSSPSPVNIMITGCRISSSCLQWLESLKTNGKIVIDACVGDDGEAVTSLGLMGIKYTRGSSSSKIPNETANRSSSGTNILHELTTQDGGYVVDASGRQSSGESSLPSLQQNPATTGLGTSIVWKLFPKFNTTLEKSVERITSSTVIMPSMETFPTSHKQTAKLKSLVKLALARLAVVRRPRVGRRSIARGDVAQLLSIGHLDRALVRAGQVLEEDDALAALDVLELYCRLLVDHAAQLDKPKECTEEIKAAAAGLIYASARCGELPELLDARAILADKFGRDFAAAARDGAPGVVDPTLVQKLSGQSATVEQMRRLAKEIAVENGILLDFPEDTREVPHAQGKQSEQAKMSVPAAKSVEQAEIKTEPCVVQDRQRPADQSVNRPSLAQLSAEGKLPRSKMSAQIPGARSLNLSLKQVQKATRKFSPSLKLSESGLWEIYKGILPDNQMVVVRRAKKNYVPVGKVHKESQLLSAINHWSLVTPLCSIDKGNEFIMISEYISNGSLRQHLHGQHKKILDLNQRILIAIDVAIALTYLHLSAAGEPLICYNLKTSKILLTESFRAKLTAFELSRSGTLDQIVGTCGYMSPEYVQRIEITAKSDVYSFGVVLLEIISSRGPLEWSREEVLQPGFFDNQPPELHPSTATLIFEKFKAGNTREILDDCLAHRVDKKFLEDWLGLASLCTAFNGDDRPRIEEVGERLWEIWKDHRKRIGESYRYERSWAEFVKEEGIPRGVESIDKSSGNEEFPNEWRATNSHGSPIYSDVTPSPPLSPR